MAQSCRQWLPRVVRSGECLSELAYRHGTRAETVWLHPKNAELKASRLNPEVLSPGDVVWLPREPARRGFDVSPGMALNAFATIPPRTIAVRLIHEDGEPLANEPFSVVGGKARPPGMTDETGCASFEVPVTGREALVTLPTRGVQLVVRPGKLRPLSTIEGAVGRLQNMGYGVHELDHLSCEQRDEYATFLFAWFQRDRGLPVTGTLDETTRSTLSRVSGDDGTWQASRS